MMVLIATLLSCPVAAQEDVGSFLKAVNAACGGLETALTEGIEEDFALPASCKKSGNDAPKVEVCRQDLQPHLVLTLRNNAEEAIQESRADLLAAVGHWDAVLVEQLYQRIDVSLAKVFQDWLRGIDDSAAMGLREVTLTSAGEVEVSAMEPTKVGKEASAGLAARCRSQVLGETLQLIELAELRRANEDAALAELKKESGFSRIVRCQWVNRAEQRPTLDCSPGLQVSGHEPSLIKIDPPPSEPDFRLAWVQAVTAEETSVRESSGGPLSCPNLETPNGRSLSYDEMCFGDAESECQPEASSIAIAVHVPRWFSTSYGCQTGSMECAVKSLRGPRGADPSPRSRLSLLTQGTTPAILVKARSADGRVVEGEVLVGYQRWRVETGGMIAVTEGGGVDHELVTTPDPDVPGNMRVTAIRDADDYAQETGIFVNFIPSNYEWFGASLGFASSDGRAPSVYLGPTIRLRSFGNRGLAALSFGVVMRQVDRFPDIEIDAVSPRSYAPDSAELQPDRRFDFSHFIGIQLGFSFGPVSTSERLPQ